MEVLLLVCDEISFNKKKKTHELGTVLNSIYVNTLPYVCDLHVFVKLLRIPEKEILDLQVAIFDLSNEIIAQTNKFSVHNQRPCDQVPGVDVNFLITTTFCIVGNCEIKLFINGELKKTYPITVRQTEALSLEV